MNNLNNTKKTHKLNYIFDQKQYLIANLYSSSKLSPLALWLYISWIACSRIFQVFSAYFGSTTTRCLNASIWKFLFFWVLISTAYELQPPKRIFNSNPKLKTQIRVLVDSKRNPGKNPKQWAWIGGWTD